MPISSRLLDYYYIILCLKVECLYYPFFSINTVPVQDLYYRSLKASQSSILVISLIPQEREGVPLITGLLIWGAIVEATSLNLRVLWLIRRSFGPIGIASLLGWPGSLLTSQLAGLGLFYRPPLRTYKGLSAARARALVRELLQTQKDRGLFRNLSLASLSYSIQAGQDLLKAVQLPLQFTHLYFLVALYEQRLLDLWEP